jgi:LysM repeat protein
LAPHSDDIPVSTPAVILAPPVKIIDIDKNTITEVTPVVVTDIKSVPLTHKVKKGESFWKISRMYGISKNELAACNNLSLTKPLKIGTVLVIPPGGVANYKPSKKPTKPKTKSTVRRSPAPVAVPVTNSDGTYTVKSGDSLWKIARRYKVTTKSLAAANNMDRNRPIQPGMKLIIPGVSSTVVNTPVKTTTPTQPVQNTSANTNTVTAAGINDDSIDDILNDAEKSAGNTTSTNNAADIISGLDSAAATADTPLADDLYVEEVLPNETLQEIAERHGLTVEDLLKVNPSIKADQKLKPFSSIKIPNKQY